MAVAEQQFGALANGSGAAKGAVRGGLAGMGGAMVGGMVARGPTRGVTGAGSVAPEQEAQQLAARIRQIGSKTFFWKNHRWVDSAVMPDDEKKACEISVARSPTTKKS